MSKRILFTFVILIIATAFILGFISHDSVKNTSLGSVMQTGEYQSTTTVGMTTGQRVINANPGTLGSIIVASSSATTFKIWNATSTTDTASSTVTQFVASPTNGTYTFDLILTRGLIIEMPTGFNGSYTITYR